MVFDIRLDTNTNSAMPAWITASTGYWATGVLKMGRELQRASLSLRRHALYPVQNEAPEIIPVLIMRKRKVDDGLQVAKL
jgi:hypothetical protein